MRSSIRSTLVVSILASLAAPGVLADEPALETEEARVLYTVGLAMSQNLASLDLTADDLAAIQAGLTDGVLGREERVDAETYAPRIREVLMARATVVMEREKLAGTELTAKAAAEAGAVTLDSGGVYLEAEPGEGAQPAAADTVTIHYHGTLRDGTVFDSSRDGDPATFAVNGVIRCFSEGLQRMKVGGKCKITCPSDSAYGDRGSPPKIRPGATLVFEIELIEIATAALPEQPPAP